MIYKNPPGVAHPTSSRHRGGGGKMLKKPTIIVVTPHRRSGDIAVFSYPVVGGDGGGRTRTYLAH